MNIWYVSHFFPPELNGGARRVYDLSKLWVQMGHCVTVLTGLPSHPDGVVPPEYRGRGFHTEHVAGVRVVRVPKFNTPNRGVILRLLNHISFAVSGFIGSLIAGGPSDVIIASSPPLFVGLGAVAIAWLRRVPLVLEVRDLWPDQAIDLGVLRNPFAVRLAKFLEQSLYRLAGAVVVVTEQARQTIIDYGVPREKVFLVRNGVDISQFTMKTPTNDPSHERPLVVTYAGTIGLSQGLSTVIEAARILHENGDKRFFFRFVGDGAEKGLLQNRTASLGLRNVEFRDPVPLDQMLDLYISSDAMLVSLRDIPVFKGTVPSKLYEIMATGSFVVALLSGEARRILMEADAGTCAYPEDVQSLLVSLEDCYARGACGRSEAGARGRAWIEAHCLRSIQARDYANILSSVGHPSGALAVGRSE